MIFHVSANESNVGDWLSAVGIRRLMDNLPAERLYCDAYFLADTLERLGRAEAGDVLIIGGGGLFQDYFMPFWRGVAPLLDRGVRFCLWGIGIAGGGLKGDSAGLVRRMAGRSAVCAVRDELTRDSLELPSNTTVTPCPAIMGARLLLTPRARQKRIVHAVHPDIVSDADSEKARQCAKAHAASTAREYRETDNRVSQGNGDELRSCVALYAGADQVISSRLHGCIIGLALGCHVLALSSDMKVRAFMESAGLGDWICPTDDAEAIGRKLATLDSQAATTALLERAESGNRRIAQAVLKITHSAMERSRQ